MNKELSNEKEKAVKEIKDLYLTLEKEIESRLSEFKRTWKNGKEEDIFAELVFCLLTPQSKAKSCDGAVGCLMDMDLLFTGNTEQIARELKGKTRFHNTKAKNVIKARGLFIKKGKLSIKSTIAQFDDPFVAREWLVENVKGMGYKEASHFLRNIGLGEELAILDRHILKNLNYLGVINEVPDSLTKKKYIGMEKKMRKFAENVKIPIGHLDLLLWYKETKEIFK